METQALRLVFGISGLENCSKILGSTHIMKLVNKMGI